jgi:protein-L-isoaspartate O-methyltransferase
VPIDPGLERMIAELKNKGIRNQVVLDVFKVVDRKFFMQN